MLLLSAPWLGKVGPEAWVGFLVGGTGACTLGDRAASGVVFQGVCELTTTLGSLPANGWDCVIVSMVACSEVSRTSTCRPLELGGDVKINTSREHMPINIP